MIRPNIRLLVVDDHEVVRLGVRYALSLQSRIEIVAEATNGEDIIAVVDRCAPDVVLMDIRLGSASDGFSLTRILKEHFPTVKVVIYSAFDDPDYVAQFLVVEADGYITKTSSPPQLTRAIEDAVAGGKPLSSEISKNLLTLKKEGPSDRTLEILSPRELEVLKLIAIGLSTRKIARQIRRSEGTVRKHRENLREKLGVRCIAELTRYAIEHKLIPPSHAGS
jgi:DNA-binding NarL/FixJ family response regulator